MSHILDGTWVVEDRVASKHDYYATEDLDKNQWPFLINIPHSLGVIQVAAVVPLAQYGQDRQIAVLLAAAPELFTALREKVTDCSCGDSDDKEYPLCSTCRKSLKLLDRIRAELKAGQTTLPGVQP